MNKNNDPQMTGSMSEPFPQREPEELSEPEEMREPQPRMNADEEDEEEEGMSDQELPEWVKNAARDIASSAATLFYVRYKEKPGPWNPKVEDCYVRYIGGLILKEYIKVVDTQK